MTNYKRIISYIYMYKSNEKIRNVGFAKIDGRNQMYKLVVSLKTPQGYGAEILNVNLITKKGDKFVGINIGSFRPINETCEFRTVIAEFNIEESGFDFSDIQGIYVSGKEKEKYYFLCQWDESQFNEDMFIPVSQYQPDKLPAEEVVLESVEVAREPQIELTKDTNIESLVEPEVPVKSEVELVAEVQPTSEVNEMQISEVEEFSQEEQVNEEINITKDELLKEVEDYAFHETEQSEMPRVAEATAYNRDLWGIITSQRTKINSRVLGRRSECIKIKPSDIGNLPRQYWGLSKNSFLLHGYYNYKYIIMAKLDNETDKGKYIIGVPGVYQKNEKTMANMFGFEEFMQLTSDLPRNNSQNPTQGIGYWCMEISI